MPYKDPIARRQKDARYRQNNRARLAVSSAEYYRMHRQEILSRQAEYRRTHYQKILAYQTEYAHTHPHELFRWRKRARMELRDGYVARLLHVKLTVKEIPQALIEAKRTQLLLWRRANEKA
jgi:hypothetical protein